MNESVANVFVIFLYILIGLIIARSLMSWFPVSPTNQFVRFLNQVTEPLLEPIRRIMPRTGMIDFSAMIVIVVLYLAIAVVRRAATS